MINELDEVPIVANTNSYSSMSSSAEQTLPNIINQFSFIKEIYFQNPTENIRKEIFNSYDKSIIETKNYDYKDITKKDILDFNDSFNSKILGQEKAKDNLLSVFYNLYKKRNKSKPYVIMFYGPSGVGKTETAKYISMLLGGNLMRKQLSMFQGNHFGEYLFGDSHNKDSLAKDLYERESNVILLDEFDKCNPGFYSAFFQLFDEGVFTDSNYSVRLKNTIIICTSNHENPEKIKQSLGDPIYYRFDKMIEFNKLNKESIGKLIEIIYDDIYESLDKDEKEVLDDENLKEEYLRLTHMFENYRHVEKLINEDVNNFLVKIFIRKEKEATK